MLYPGHSISSYWLDYYECRRVYMLYTGQNTLKVLEFNVLVNRIKPLLICSDFSFITSLSNQVQLFRFQFHDITVKPGSIVQISVS